MIIIRKYSSKDRKGILSLMMEFLDYKQEVYDPYVMEFIDCSDKQGYAKSLLRWSLGKKEKVMYLAIDKKKIVGYIFGYTFETPHNKSRKTGLIESYFVTKSYRRKGVGKILYDELINWFKKKHCDSLDLYIFNGNSTTKKIYRNWGFKEIQTRMRKKI